MEHIEKLTPSLLRYIEDMKPPNMSDVIEYEKLAKIGQGTFGEVFKAKHKQSGAIVALKKILMDNEKEGFPITALREIKMLQRLRHKNITELIEVTAARTRNSMSHGRSTFFLVFRFCEHDLAGLLSNKQVKLTLAEIKCIMKQMLEGLYFIHMQKVLHRDMKAANVLITRDGSVKLADFGLARPILVPFPDTANKGRELPAYTNRVVTLWYRPPELLLGDRHYNDRIDMWGVGCIMAEMWTRNPIMQGDTEQKQLQYIVHLCGPIDPTTWEGVDKLPYYDKFDLKEENPQRRVKHRLGPFIKDAAALTLLDSQFYHFSSNNCHCDQGHMLTLDPKKRLSAEVALLDDWFFVDPLASPNLDQMMRTAPVSNFEYTVPRRRPQGGPGGLPGAHMVHPQQGGPSNQGQPPAKKPNVHSLMRGGLVDRTY